MVKTTTQNNEERLACANDSVYFINHYLQFESLSGSSNMILNTMKIELIEAIESEKRVIGRYPRLFGKTTTLMGVALHKALFHGQTVIYCSYNTVQRIGFLRGISAMYSRLPEWMTDYHTEGPERFVIGKGGIFVHGMNDLEAYRADLWLFDEVGKMSQYTINPIINPSKLLGSKLVIVGTFTKDDIGLGSIWAEARTKGTTGWTSLPTPEEAWKVNAILTLADSRYSQDY